MSNYQDIWYTSSDGLKLYARDYNSGNRTAVPILCMHGLSRNSADFEALADVLSEQYRVIAVDQRGRGLSQWDSDTSHYTPMVYVQDMWQLLEQLDIERVIAVGTSMGGLMGMMMAAERPARMAGLVLNDVGPAVAAAGLQRIMSYVGKGKPVHCWEDAIAETRRLNEVCFPQYAAADWKSMAQRMYRENQQGVPELAYDPAISAAIDQDDSNLVPPELWPLFEQLNDVALLAIRGQLSDILSSETFAKMQKVLPHMRAVEVPDVGHAPALDEPVAQQAIVAFVESLQSENMEVLC